MALGFNFQGIKAGNSNAVPMSIDIHPSPLILAGMFGALAEGVRSYRKPLEKAIREVVIPSIRENFNVAGRPPWTPLSGYTEATRVRLGYGVGIGAEILVRKGKLKRSATAFARWSFDKQTAWVGNDFPGDAWYGPIQQNGFEGGYGAITPPRPFMMVQPQDEEKIQQVFLHWLGERVNASGI